MLLLPDALARSVVSSILKKQPAYNVSMMCLLREIAEEFYFTMMPLFDATLLLR